MKLAGQVFLVALALMMFDLSSNVAEAGFLWFGPNREYKCHCTLNNCDENGLCTFGSECEQGWFGPGCQYSQERGKVAGTIYTTWLADDDDTTCGADSSGTLDKYHATAQMIVPYRFSWMRIAVKDRGLDILNNMTITFNYGAMKCENMRAAVVSSTLLDIHCDLRDAVEIIEFDGEGVMSLCSVYVSGGRNIALRQTTTQTSTIGDNPQTDSSLAVDDNKEGSYVDKGECASTANDGSDSNPTWTLTFPQPMAIYNYYVYTGINSTGDRTERTMYFELRAFNEEGAQVFLHTNEEVFFWKYLGYYFPSSENTTAISKISITAIDNENATTPYPVLILCEVQVYGDVVCPEGRYGRNCEHECNCANGESCFVSTGGCPSGCAEGFYGEDCKTSCPDTLYGSGCTHKCSDGCVNDMCNRTDGTCECKIGRIGIRCEEHCPPGKYDVGCKSNCSTTCGRDGSCNPENGSCTYGCVSGYRGPYCNDSCSTMTYGENCNKTCSDHCDKSNLMPSDRICDRFNGTCIQGCKPGSGAKGPLCEPNNEAAGRDFSRITVLMVALGSLLIFWTTY